MRFLYKILALCSLLIMSVGAFAQITTTTSGNLTTFTLGDSTKSVTLHGNAVNASAYQWYKNGVMISGALSQTYTVTANGFYTVVAFSAEGCPSPHADSVSVVFTNPTTPPPVVTPPPVTTPVVDSVDLATTISSSNTQASVGDNYSYVITAGDNSSTDGTNVQLTYTIPSNLTYVSQSQSNGTVNYNAASKTLTWTIPDLAKSSSANLTVNVTAAQAGVSVSSVAITGTQFDPGMANNTSTIQQQITAAVVVPPPVVTPVVDSVDLTASILSSNTQTTLGNNYSYTITAGNNSNNDGTNVQLSYTIPSNLTYVSQTQNDGTVNYNDSTKTLIWTIPTLEKNSSANLTVNVMVASAGLSVSTVSIAGTQFDPNLQNNTSTIEQQVNSLVVPNVFTPNGDGVNDAFVVPGLENFSDNQLSVMNRWGSEVYVRKNYKNDWTGQGLVEGTYFYILKTKTSLGNWEVYKGYITLLRSHL